MPSDPKLPPEAPQVVREEGGYDEPLVVREVRSSPRAWLWTALLVLLVVAAGINLTARLNARRSASELGSPEAQAMRELTRIGAAERAYATRNIRRKYGTLDELTRSPGFPATYSRREAIPSYSLVLWSLTDPVWAEAPPGEPAPGEPLRTRVAITPARFTIVAVPTGGARGLRTFAICEDEVVRTSPHSGAALEESCDWPAVTP